MIKRIVTHPGKAHLDDFFATCLILAAHHECDTITRTNPSHIDLRDPEVCVLDVGGAHDPEFMNFDHHQFEVGNVPQCAITLVLKHLGVYELATYSPWLKLAETYDVAGPIAAAELLGCPVGNLAMINNPVAAAVLRGFEQFEHDNRVESWAVALMRSIGIGYLEGLYRLKARLPLLPSSVVVRDVPVFGDFPQKIVGVPAIAAEDNPNLGLEIYFDQLGIAPIATVTKSRRAEDCWYLFRTTGSEQLLDFRKTPNCSFRHANGFMAQTIPMDFEDAMNLVVETLTI